MLLNDSLRSILNGKLIITARGLEIFWALSPWDPCLGEVGYGKLVSMISYLFSSCLYSAGCYWVLNKQIFYLAWILDRNFNILLLMLSLILFLLFVWNDFRHEIFWLNILKLYIYVWFQFIAGYCVKKPKIKFKQIIRLKLN